MVTTYGSFPGVQVSVSGGGITAIAIGGEEKLVLFGEANYQNDSDFSPGDGEEDPLVADLIGSTNTPESISARRVADDTFGDGSELADAMREALGNGANIDYLYGVAPQRINVVDESQTTQSGSLDQDTVWEEDVSEDANIAAIEVDDVDGTGTVITGTADIDIELSYDGAPTTPTDDTADVDTVVINPLTGEYAADQAPTDHFEFRYKYLDWTTAFEAQAVTNVVNEDETAIFDAVSDSDSVSASLSGQTTTLRRNYQLVNGLSGAEPNDNEVVNDSDGNYLRRDAQYDTANYDTANQSVDSDSYFKLAPVREENTPKTVLGAVGGLFAGNPLNDPIYNDKITGVESLEESFTKAHADDMRGENIIPIRQAGSIRVKDNRSTSTDTDWERDFWRRRIADRIILIGKSIGDAIIGRINDDDTRDAAARLIRAELRELVDDRLLKPNTDEDLRWSVDVYPDPTDNDKVKIDIAFTPYGIVKRVEETVTINT